MRKRLDGPQPGEALALALLLGHLCFPLALLGHKRVLIDVLNILQPLVRDLGARDGRLDQNGVFEGLLFSLFDRLLLFLGSELRRGHRRERRVCHLPRGDALVQRHAVGLLQIECKCTKALPA